MSNTNHLMPATWHLESGENRLRSFKAKPADCSDVRWRIELRRRERDKMKMRCSDMLKCNA